METSITCHIQHAHNGASIRPAARRGKLSISLLATVLCWTLAYANFDKAEQVIDLTKKRPVNAKTMPMPGSSAGGIVGGERPIFEPPRYSLALEAKVRAIRRDSLAEGQKLVIELLLRNTGKEPFYLPVSQDSYGTHHPGNTGRRTFLFSVRFVGGNGQSLDEDGIAATSGAESRPDSLLRIEPQKSVLVLLPADSTQASRRLPADAKTMAVQIICKEWSLEDSRYFIKSISHEIQSSNAVQIELPSRKPTGVQ